MDELKPKPKRKIIRTPRDVSQPLGQPDFADKSLSPGQPGYRTRPSHSGLDPEDTYSELGRMQGLLVRNLFTGRLRIRNPILLAFMSIAGLSACLLASYAIANVIGGYMDTTTLVCFAPLGIVGFALLVNVALSLITLPSTRHRRK